MLAILAIPLWFLIMFWCFQAIDWLQKKAQVSDDDMNTMALVLLLTSRNR